MNINKIVCLYETLVMKSGNPDKLFGIWAKQAIELWSNYSLFFVAIYKPKTYKDKDL